MSRSLFDSEDEPTQAARLAPRLRSLAQQGVFFGTSSWKYEGWLGTIYTPERYRTRNRFSRRKFEAECLREYAETFPSVGGDFSFYQFPSAEIWARVFEGTPPTFSFGLKVPEQLTVARWPLHKRYGSHAGSQNMSFLDAEIFKSAFLQALEPYRKQVAAVMFEFGAFAKADFAAPEAFFARLEGFLGALPRGWRYAVEIRNTDYLKPEYFAVLARHNVAHIFNAWTRMPTLADQISMPDAFTADFTVTRALLQRGRTYEQAVEMFKPYRELQQPNEPVRVAICEIARRAIRKRERAYVFVNNRLEGHAPTTIEAVVSDLND